MMRLILQPSKIWDIKIHDKNILQRSFSETFGDLWGHWKRIFKSNIAMEEQIVNWPHKSYGSICLFSPCNIIYTHCELKSILFLNHPYYFYMSLVLTYTVTEKQRLHACVNSKQIIALI